MGQGVDLRVQRTEKALTESLTSLMEEMRYEDITIGALCDRAMIRRATFYKHFADKDDFFGFYMERLHDEFLARGSAQMHSKDLRELSIHMYNELTDFFCEHERLLDNVLRSNAMPALSYAFGRYVIESLSKEIRAANEEGRLQDCAGNPEAFAAFVAGAMIDSLVYWWTHGRREADRAQTARLLDKLYA